MHPIQQAMRGRGYSSSCVILERNEDVGKNRNGEEVIRQPLCHGPHTQVVRREKLGSREEERTWIRMKYNPKIEHTI